MDHRFLKGYFTIEGTEGAGKTLLLERLKSNIPDAVFTYEPGGTPVADMYRALVKQNEMEPLAELYGYLAARHENFIKTILPAANEDKLIFSDRNMTSSLVYQGEFRGLDKDLIYSESLRCTKNYLPEGLIILVCEPETGKTRAASRNGAVHDKFDDYGLDFYKKTYLGYMNIIQEYKLSESLLVIDTTHLTPDEVYQKVLEFIQI